MPLLNHHTSGKIQEECFKYLDMPAIPLNSTLEQTMIPSIEKVKAKIEKLLNYFFRNRFQLK